MSWYDELENIEHLDLSDEYIDDDTLEVLYNHPTLQSLDVSGRSIGDRGIAVIATIPNLECLNIEATHVTDQGLSALMQSSFLSTIWMARTNISNNGLYTLGNMKSLNVLGLENTNITDEGLQGLQGNKFYRLFLDGTKVYGRGLRYISSVSMRELRLSCIEASIAIDEISRFSKLKTIWLKDSEIKNINNQSWSNLGSVDTLYLQNIQADYHFWESLYILPKLTRLCITGGSISDEDLLVIGKMNGLRSIWLRNTNITSSGLKYIVGLQNLRNLDLTSTLVNDDSLTLIDQLSGLESISINGTLVSDDGMTWIYRRIDERNNLRLRG
ncbi:hypothetical protein F8S13_14560 [Chloroflexia bacterium SDU3-3]|nr:hypothetical protein F8S13_14560 [Chloroflexia bacterium SDU3-3]